MGKQITYLALSVLVIAFALIGCGGGGGGGTASPVGPAVTAGAVADLTGVVSLSGQPLSEAAVYLYSSDKALQAGVSNLPSLRGSVLAQTRLADGSYFTKTDTTGRYSFSGIPVGEYTLIAVKDEAHQFAQTGVLLGSVTTADAQLTPTGKVSGKVQLTSGQAVAGAIVHLEKTSYVAISDVNGDFVINHVPAGQSFNLGVVSTMGTLSNTVPVILTPAEDKSLGVISLAVPTQQLANITGSITTTDSAVPASALAGRIVIVTSADPSPLVAMSDSAGNFSLAVKAVGNYNISVVGGEYAVSPNMQTINVAALNSTLSLPQPFVMSKPAVVLPPTTQYFAFSGTVNKRSMAFNEPDQAGVTLTLTAQDGSGKIYSAVTSPTGAFTFNVPSGNFNFAVGGGYAFETTFTNPVAITANTALTATVWVVPTQVFATSYLVEGSLSKETLINNETDNSNVMVTLTPTTGAAVTYAGATGGTGNFAIRVPAGTYNMAITGAYRFKTAFTNPVAVSANVNVGTGILLVPAIAPVQNFLVTGTAQKTIFVNSESTHAGTTIALTPTSGAAQTYTSVTNTSGDFSITVPAGTYNLTVISSSYRSTVNTPSAITVTADLTLGVFSIAPVETPYQMHTVGGTILKTQFVDGEVAHAGVTVALSPTSGSGNTYSTVTTAVGSFSVEVPAGIYNVSIISSRYKPASPLPNPVNVSSNMVIADIAIVPITAPVAVFNFGGTALKSLFVDGETNHANVTIAMTPTSGSGNTYTAATTNIGSFSMQVPVGSYNLSVISSLYKPAAALTNPIVVSGNQVLPAFNLNPINPPLIQYVVEGWLNKTAYIEGDSVNGNAGVVVTLTSTSATPKTYDTVTNSSGYFKMTVNPDIYNLGVSSGYKFVAAPSPYDATSANVSISPALNIVPLADKLFVLSGSVNKIIRLSGEFDNGDVNITLKEQSAVTQSLTTVSNAAGYFKFTVPIGTYTIEIGSSYEPVTPITGYPFAISNADLAAGNLDIRPVSLLPAKIRGSISPLNVGDYMVKLKQVVGGTYTDYDTAPSETGTFAFFDVPPGTYSLAVLPTGNGYFIEFPQFFVAGGANLVLPAVTANPVAPVINSFTTPQTGDRLYIQGSNFPTVLANAKYLIDGNPVAHYSLDALTSTNATIMVESITPGDHNVVVENAWTRPATGEVYYLRSRALNFTRTLDAPTGLVVDYITNNGATISWVNGRFSETTKVEIWTTTPPIAPVFAAAFVEGSSYVITGLASATTYDVVINNTYGGILSAPVSLSPQLTTMQNANYGIATTQLVNTSAFAGSKIIGFEVVNGVYYVARCFGDYYYIAIYSYDANGNELNNTHLTNPIYLNGTGYGNSMSFTSGGGQLFLQYSDGGTIPVVTINSYNADLTLADSQVIPSASYQENQLHYADGKLFSLGTMYGDGVALSELRYFYPAANLASSIIISSQYISMQSTPLAGGRSEFLCSARMCSDNNNLYLANVVTPSSMPDTISLARIPFTDLTTSVPITELVYTLATYPLGIEQLSSVNGQIFMKSDDAMTESNYLINNLSGYVSEQPGWINRGNYVADSKGRAWICELDSRSFGSGFYQQLDAAGQVVKSLKIAAPVSLGYNAPGPGEFIKTNIADNSFHMLYVDDSYNFSVFHYPSTY